MKFPCRKMVAPCARNGGHEALVSASRTLEWELAALVSASRTLEWGTRGPRVGLHDPENPGTGNLRINIHPFLTKSTIPLAWGQASFGGRRKGGLLTLSGGRGSRRRGRNMRKTIPARRLRRAGPAGAGSWARSLLNPAMPAIGYAAFGRVRLMLSRRDRADSSAADLRRVAGFAWPHPLDADRSSGGNAGRRSRSMPSIRWPRRR